MASTSAISLCSLPKVSLRPHSHKQRRVQVLGGPRLGYPATSFSFRRNRSLLRFRSLVVKVSDSSRAEGGARRSASGRRVYRQSQSQSSLSAAPVQQVAKVVVPAGMFFAVTFDQGGGRAVSAFPIPAPPTFGIGLYSHPHHSPSSLPYLGRILAGNIVIPIKFAKNLPSRTVFGGQHYSVTHRSESLTVLWKVVEKLLTPKSKRASNAEQKTHAQGLKWSFAPGTNLLSGRGAKIDRESKERLNEFAKELRAFSVVDMTGCNFGDEGLVFLAERLAYNQTLEGVSFAGNGITATGLKAFDGILQSNITLKTLDLSGNPIGDEGAKCLSDILAGNSGITKLQLNSTNLGDEGAKAIAELLKKNSSLCYVELNNNMIDYAVWKPLNGFTSLAGALLENKTIRDIQLNGNYGGALGANALAKGLEGNKSLKELHLHGNSIGDEGIRALMSGLSQHKGGKLTRLEIGNNSISAKGAFHVAEYVKKNKSLLLLNISMNDIGDEGAEKIGDALKENRSIRSIDLAGNNIHVQGVGAIASALKDNSIVTVLEIGYNPIGPEGAKVFADVLKFHGNINILKLGWCQIGAKGAESIADMLKYNSTLSELDLRGNGLRDEGAICLARSLKVVNEALSSLDLGFNEIRDDGAFAIAQALKANEDVRITSLNLSRNLMTKFGQSALTDARDHVYEMTEKEVYVIF
ncbi:hypothetical protein TIFTF001_010907 [Ficus carica]|uniref:Protein NLRC3 n=1 Tax=Ficus carica TaxID=3494 RepID=A0AA88AD21_FICCA|nr:hypothetical protein TIFTF001_010907 [Ficus carica]